MYKSVVPCYAQ